MPSHEPTGAQASVLLPPSRLRSQNTVHSPHLLLSSISVRLLGSCSVLFLLLNTGGFIFTFCVEGMANLVCSSCDSSVTVQTELELLNAAQRTCHLLYFYFHLLIFNHTYYFIIIFSVACPYFPIDTHSSTLPLTLFVAVIVAEKQINKLIFSHLYRSLIFIMWPFSKQEYLNDCYFLQ